MRVYVKTATNGTPQLFVDGKETAVGKEEILFTLTLVRKALIMQMAIWTMLLGIVIWMIIAADLPPVRVFFAIIGCIFACKEVIHVVIYLRMTTVAWRYATRD